MRLFEAILDANHRAVAGDASAGLHPADYEDSLPVVALTCIDPRLNAYFPNALGLPVEQFIWLRNAGNIITSSMSSTMRSLALACAVKGGREIAIIGHTDCQISRTTTMVLLDKLKALGIDRNRLPENITDFFGTFSSERQNVIKACDYVRNSPIIGPKIPVHGLLLDIETGSLNWVVNGYQVLQTVATPSVASHVPAPKVGDPMEAIGSFKDFALGEMKFPEAKIGEAALHLEKRLGQAVQNAEAKLEKKIAPAVETVESMGKVLDQVAQYADKNWPKAPPIRMRPAPPPLPPKKQPLPPPIRPKADFRRD
ncbi:MAG TPA: carbonic anhydrase [Verrucomicrobiae bacterium]